jgi:hypothetical protein
MRLPVDTDAVSVLAAGPPEPAFEYGTKQQEVDDKGVAVNKVHLIVVGGGTREIVTVKVPGDMRGVGELTPVKVTDLVANTWTIDDRSGVSFRAAKVEALTQKASA